MRVFQRAGALVGGLLLAAEDHHDAACRIELDHHVGAFVGDPDVVVFVDSHRVREGPCVEIVSDLAEVRAVGTKLEKLGGGCTVRWASGVASREYEDVSLGVHGYAGGFAQIHVRRKL